MINIFYKMHSVTDNYPNNRDRVAHISTQNVWMNQQIYYLSRIEANVIFW